MFQIRKKALGTACALSLAVCAFTANAALPPGISGSWYNPDQSGHGLSLEILSPDSALFYWYTYDTDGHPIHLYIEGRIEGRTIHGKAWAPQGMKFGQFDPQDLQLPEWGSVTLEFSSCNTGTLSWNSDLPEFGEGTLPLTRLTAISGLWCDLDSSRHPFKGLYDVRLTPSQTGGLRSGIAAVDGNGHLWAIDFAGRPDVSPAPNWIAAVNPCVALGSVNLPELGTSSLLTRGNSWQSSQARLGCDTRGWQGPARIETNGFSLDSANAADATTWTFTARANATLVTPLTLEDLQGTRTVRLRGQFEWDVYPSTLTVDADGAVCLDRRDAGHLLACGYRGRLELDPQDPGFLNVELGIPGAFPFKGRGWIESTPAGKRLVLIGMDGENGMAIVAQ